MDLPLNHNTPTVMHIDLDSCFATIEQQANPLLRGKPLVVAAYGTPNGCVLSPSIEAKRFGVKTGMTVRDARLMCKGMIVRTPDPSKYRDVHMKFRTIFNDYSPSVSPRSIDEAILDFANTPHLVKGLDNIGREIKLRMRREIGEWIQCSIGIAPNRFLAKMGAGINKPNGLKVITHENLIEVYTNLKLTDLYGIASRNEARLNTYGIFTPLDFLNAKVDYLKNQVFKSMVGYYWYLRLRGWEIDAVDWATKSYGQEYSLGEKTDDPGKLSVLLMKLTEKMGRRLRAAGKAACGIHIACVYDDMTHWHRGRKQEKQLYTTAELFNKAQWLLNQQPERKVVRKLAVSCFDLVEATTPQMDLFGTQVDRRRNVSDAMDKINDRYGEFVITPALMMGMNGLVVDRIAFGNVRGIEDLYE